MSQVLSPAAGRSNRHGHSLILKGACLTAVGCLAAVVLCSLSYAQEKGGKTPPAPKDNAQPVVTLLGLPKRSTSGEILFFSSRLFQRSRLSSWERTTASCAERSFASPCC